MCSFNLILHPIINSCFALAVHQHYSETNSSYRSKIPRTKGTKPTNKQNETTKNNQTKTQQRQTICTTTKNTHKAKKPHTHPPAVTKPNHPTSQWWVWSRGFGTHQKAIPYLGNTCTSGRVYCSFILKPPRELELNGDSILRSQRNHQDGMLWLQAAVPTCYIYIIAKPPTFCTPILTRNFRQKDPTYSQASEFTTKSFICKTGD